MDTDKVEAFQVDCIREVIGSDTPYILGAAKEIAKEIIDEIENQGHDTFEGIDSRLYPNIYRLNKFAQDLITLSNGLNGILGYEED